MIGSAHPAAAVVRPRLAAVIVIAVAAAAAAVAGCTPARGPSAGPIAQSALAPSLGVDLSAMDRTLTGLYMRTLREGGGPVARTGSEVRVHYEGWFADGTKFDSSRDRGQPITVPIGEGVVIAAWDEAIVGMRVGEIRRLVVPPELGYGAEGVPGAIPPDAVLIFEIELLGVT